MGSRNNRNRQTIRTLETSAFELTEAGLEALDDARPLRPGDRLEELVDDEFTRMIAADLDPLYDDDEEELHHQLLYVQTRSDPK